jgi:disulfide bond formation protein DsbB
MFETMRLFFALLTVVANVLVVGGLLVAIGGQFSSGLADVRARAAEALAGREITLALIVALVATLGSLYLSEVEHLIPCTYCWYQRIAMYPLTVLFGIAAWRRDPEIRHYAAPLAGIGLLISGYHYLIQQVPSLSGPACSSVIPCSSAYFYEFGFMSIPYMAGSAFALILMFMVILHTNSRRDGALLTSATTEDA